MKSGRGMVEIFGKCSRLLSKIALNAGDGFFSQLCAKESDRLLSGFVFFLKGEENTENRVAQYHLRLISRIENILNLLGILKHLGFAETGTSLLLEKNLLLLKLSVLNTQQPAAQLSTETEKPVPLKIKKANPGRSPRLNRPKTNPPKLGRIHREISEFIKSKERTQNQEVFSRFNDVARRTMKRKLSELIQAGTIRRFTEGRKVFYSAP